MRERTNRNGCGRKLIVESNWLSQAGLETPLILEATSCTLLLGGNSNKAYPTAKKAEAMALENQTNVAAESEIAPHPNPFFKPNLTNWNWDDVIVIPSDDVEADAKTKRRGSCLNGSYGLDKLKAKKINGQKLGISTCVFF
ncbi:hypothetical protein Tco_0697046 [Tanacetum coccineum]